MGPPVFVTTGTIRAAWATGAAPGPRAEAGPGAGPVGGAEGGRRRISYELHLRRTGLRVHHRVGHVLALERMHAAYVFMSPAIFVTSPPAATAPTMPAPPPGASMPSIPSARDDRPGPSP